MGHHCRQPCIFKWWAEIVIAGLELMAGAAVFVFIFITFIALLMKWMTILGRKLDL